MVEQIMRSSDPHRMPTDFANSLLLNIGFPSQVLVDARDSTFAQAFCNRSGGSYASNQESRIDTCGCNPDLDSVGSLF